MARDKVGNMPLLNQIKSMLEDIRSRLGRLEGHSTNDVRIGTWIDGKPLYRKTVTYNLGTASGNITKATGLSNVDSIVNVYGLWSVDNNVSYIPLVSWRSDNIAWSLTFDYISKANNTITFYRGSNRTTADKYPIVTYEYTKTTD